MNDLYLVRGLPGSGKTALVESLRQEGDFAVSNDEFRLDEDGRYVYNAAMTAEVNRRCADAVELAMKRGVERIFVHCTLVRSWDLEAYRELAARFNYRVFFLVVENRHGGKNSHGVPQEVIEDKAKTFDIKLC